MIAWIKKIWFRLTWQQKVCPSCENLKCVSNFSPCYGCQCGSNYEPRSMLRTDIERKVVNSMAIACPKCGSETKTIDSRKMGLTNSQWRRRKCTNPRCGCRFNTIESIAEGSITMPKKPSSESDAEILDDLRSKFGV